MLGLVDSEFCGPVLVFTNFPCVVMIIVTEFGVWATCSCAAVAVLFGCSCGQCHSEYLSTVLKLFGLSFVSVFVLRCFCLAAVKRILYRITVV